jgi:hypothetical protein
MSASSGQSLASFKLEASNVLGVQYSSFISRTRAYALSNPSGYFRLRETVLKNIKEKLITDVYNMTFEMLTLGQSPSYGIPVSGTDSGFILSRDLIPNFPSQKANDMAINFSSDVADFCNKIVDVLLSDDFQRLSDAKLDLRARGGAVGGGNV